MNLPKQPFTWHQILPCSGQTDAEVKARRSAICALAIDAGSIWPIDYTTDKTKDIGVCQVWATLLQGEQNGAANEHLDEAVKIATKMIRRKHLPIPLGSVDAKRYREGVKITCLALYALKTNNPSAQLRALQSAFHAAESCGVSAFVLAQIALIAARPYLKSPTT